MWLITKAQGSHNQATSSHNLQDCCRQSLRRSHSSTVPGEGRPSSLAALPTPRHAILGRASLSVYVLQQHMAVTRCQGSSSPGPAPPARGQMAAHWALRSSTPLRSRLGDGAHSFPSFPRLLLSNPVAAPPCIPVSARQDSSLAADSSWSPSKPNATYKIRRREEVGQNIPFLLLVYGC